MLRLPANCHLLRSMPRKSASPPPPAEAAASSGATTAGKRPADQPPDLTPAQKSLRSKPTRATEDSDKKVDFFEGNAIFVLLSFVLTIVYVCILKLSN